MYNNNDNNITSGVPPITNIIKKNINKPLLTIKKPNTKPNKTKQTKITIPTFLRPKYLHKKKIHLSFSLSRLLKNYNLNDFRKKTKTT